MSAPQTKVFDGKLRQAFRRETELLFETILREDRSVVDLLDADYTFVDERLARHYGIPNIRGSRFRRVTLDGDARRGLLGHGSFLTVTSAGNRTSPVKRGKWVLENLLGAPVPQSAAGSGDQPRRQVRERAPRPARCGSVSNGIGPIQAAPRVTASWIRSVSRSRTSTWSASGEMLTAVCRSILTGRLVDGTELTGPASLRQALLGHRDRICRHGHREVADLRAWPERRILRHADDPVDCQGRSARRLSTLVARGRDRQERSRFGCGRNRDKAGICRRQRRTRSRGGFVACFRMIRTRHQGVSGHVHLEKASPAPDVLERGGRVARAASAGVDDAGGHGARPHGGGAEDPARVHLHSARRDDGQVDARRGRDDVRLSRKSCSRSSRFAIASASSAIWLTRRWRHGRARTRAARKTTCGRPRSS